MSVRQHLGSRTKSNSEEYVILPSGTVPGSEASRGFTKVTWRSRAGQLRDIFVYLGTNQYLWYGALVLVVAYLYYAFLASLYLVDEVYEANSLRELTLEEKFTIRVVAPRNNDGQLQNFVGKYSICQSVEEIQVVWGHTAEPPPAATSFTYTKTHCPVVFDVIDAELEWPPIHYGSTNPKYIKTRTEGIFLMEVDMEMRCEDLSFVHSVWRSGRESLVGVLPRVHVKDPVTAQYTYHSWHHVWWNRVYSLVLSGGVMAHNAVLQQTFNPDQPLQKLLAKHPECYNVGLTMWAASAHKRPLSGEGRGSGKEGVRRPVVWAQVPVTRNGGAASAHMDVHAKKEADKRVANGGKKRATSCECLTMLAADLGIDEVPYSRSKAVVAKKKLWW
jgi:hypothetical protein